MMISSTVAPFCVLGSGFSVVVSAAWPAAGRQVVGPFLGDLAVFDAVDRCPDHLDLAAGGGAPGKVSSVYAVGSEPGDDLVAFGDLILDFMPAGRGVPEHAE